MSSKKIYKTVGIEEEVVIQLEEMAKLEDRNFSGMVRKILRDHCHISGAGEEEQKNAN